MLQHEKMSTYYGKLRVKLEASVPGKIVENYDYAVTPGTDHNKETVCFDSSDAFCSLDASHISRVLSESCVRLSVEGVRKDQQLLR